MEKEICNQYGFNNVSLSKILTGVGGFTYLVEANCGRYVLKGIPCNDDYVKNEPYLAEFLKSKGIPVADYIKNNDGQYLWLYDKNLYHMQRFVEGLVFPFNRAPNWFMRESAEILGKIHVALSEFETLPIGMGEGFIKFIQSDHPRISYTNTLKKALELNDVEIIADIEYRLSLIRRLQEMAFDITRFTCCNTHGDYKISQVICKDNHIAAVIDWTTACVHPVCWEIIRSFAYADPICMNGEIDSDGLIEYTKTYLRYHPLNEYDLRMMPYFFYHQLLACDYYGQYYGAYDLNRDDFLFQAKFATGLIKWFDQHVDELSKNLCALF